MIRAVRALAVLALVTCSLLAPGVRAAEPVDLLLVLASDVSRSVDNAKFKLQREGYASAIANPQVLEAISSGVHRRIAVCFVEWSGSTSQKVLIEWTLISDSASARQFGDRLLETPRAFADRTSISAAIEFSMAQFDRAMFQATRRTIDVSGDGTNNSGRDVGIVRDEAVGNGVTINGLVILSERAIPWNPEHTNPPGGLASYYRDHVMGGPGAFVIVAQDFNAFGQAIVKKLIAEIAMLPQPSGGLLPR
jgi:hypothetical protein